MSKTVNISSSDQFQALLKSSTVVVTDFYADWCGPCKAIAPVYEQLSAQLSRPSKVTFCKVNVDNQRAIAQQYGVSAMPTFMVFKNSHAVETVKGADPRKLNELVRKIAQEAESSDGGGEGSSSSAAAGGFGEGKWLGAALPRGFADATEQIDVRGLDLLNADSGAGGVRVLFEGKQPSGLGKGKGKGKGKDGSAGAKDWVESDTDEQLMLYVPFQSTLKVHSLHITSVTAAGAQGGNEDGADDDDEVPMRPRTIRLYTNRANNMGFDEADSVVATQEVTLEEKDWDAQTATAKVELRYVKFQNVTSLVVFVVDGDSDGEKTRIDRVRVVGEVGTKREMGKLEKAGDE